MKLLRIGVYDNTMRNDPLVASSREATASGFIQWVSLQENDRINRKRGAFKWDEVDAVDA